MKRLLSLILILMMLVSLPAFAFAGDNPSSHTVPEDEPDVFEPIPVEDVDLESIPMPKDVSIDDDDVVVDKLANSPDYIKETAKKELGALKRSGYTIDCGFGAWSKSGKTLSCTVRLSEEDVPEGSEIFVNGSVVKPEYKDGGYFFPVKLPGVIIVAHK